LYDPVTYIITGFGISLNYYYFNYINISFGNDRYLQKYYLYKNMHGKVYVIIIIILYRGVQ